MVEAQPIKYIDFIERYKFSRKEINVVPKNKGFVKNRSNLCQCVAI
jgi:hypothetical protein